MKKLMLVVCLLLFGTCGGEVCATELQNPEVRTILTRCEQVMSAKRVIAMDLYVTIDGQREKIMAIALDDRNETGYIELLGGKMYVDEEHELLYFYDTDAKRWYVVDADTEDIDVDDFFDMEERVEFEDEDATYQYNGSCQYQSVTCEKITACVNDGEDGNYTLVYYVNAATYELAGLTVEADGYSYEYIYSYPTAFAIPKKVTNSAVLAPGSSIKIGRLVYTAPKSAKGRVVRVTKGTKAVGRVVIPDSVTFAGKSYKVNGIEDKAFSGNRRITRVTIGKNVKTIGKKAFYQCRRLKQVVIRSTGVTKIGKKAFYGNAKKLKIKAPKTKVKKYKNMLKKSKISSKWTISK